MGDNEAGQGCLRCGDAVEHDRDSRLCDECDKHIQRQLLAFGAACDRCNGHGIVADPICDIKRARNGREHICSECGGSGRVDWHPDLDDVHPDLRSEVNAHVEW